MEFGDTIIEKLTKDKLEMKRFFLILTVILALCAITLPRRTYASESAEYSISGDGSEYSLSLSGEIIRRGEMDEILLSVPDGSSVRFSGVETCSSFEIPGGSYIFSGELTLLSGGITVREGSELSLIGLTLDASDGDSVAISVRGGTLTIDSSEIVGGELGAILVDYSERGVATIRNSSVCSASYGAAVRVHSGSLSVFSGSISNTLGVAIESRASLSLAGEPEISGVLYDICASRAVALSVSDEEYLARHALDLMYDGIFSEGEAYEIFTKASESAVSRASVFDKNGKKYTLSYFSESPVDGEDSVAMVYLPHEVRFFDGARELSCIRALKGEIITPPEAPERTGYEFSCWTTASGETPDLSLALSGNMTLYSKYRLVAPSFRISSLSVGYTGEEYALAFSEISHPMDELGGFAELVWYKSGEIISRAGSVAIRDVADSGEYSCLITYSYESDSTSVLVEDISVTVRPKEIPIPTLASVPYDGAVKYPMGIDSAVFDFECDGFTDAGAYEIAVRLIDGENCVFSGTSSERALVIFEITKAENRFTTPPEVKSVFEGGALDIRCEALFGEVRLLFSDSPTGEYTAAPPTAAGRYYLCAAVSEGQNYSSLTSEPVEFEILADYCVSLEIAEREEAMYLAFDRFVGEGVLLLAKYKSGREVSVEMPSVSVRYQRGNYLRYGDSGVILSFGGISITYPLTVGKADYPIDALELSECRITYDGRYHEYSFGNPNIVGRDGIPLTVRAIGGGTNAGEYPIRIIFSSESTDYNIPEEREVVMIIEPCELELSWGDLSFVYDGAKKKPTCSYTDVFGIVRRPEVSGEMVNAGSGYTARANIENGNYRFTNETVAFEIRKASYDMSSVEWQGGEFVYNGTLQSVTLVGLPSGVSVVGYTDAGKSDAGAYLAYATLTYDEQNYERPEIEPHAWTIHKASYDLSDFQIESETAVFDGMEHYPRVTGNAPTGADGIELRYSFSRGVTHVSDGSVAVRVEFSTESDNYTVPDARVVYVTVLPKEVSVVWYGSELTYNGDAILPRAECAECEIEVLGAGIDAGSYTATARSKNSDYTVTNSSFDFVIRKAENRFLNEIEVSPVYTERDISHNAHSLFGEVSILVFSDAECTVPTEISEGGRYYLVFQVSESQNYTALRSDSIEITVVELSITNVSAELLRTDFLAFESLRSEDFVLTVYYNDGTSIECDISEVTIEYQRASSFRRGDTEVAIGFGGYREVCSVSVDFATLDLSGVIWEGVTHTYDGQEKRPAPTYLPAGVSVTGFVEGGGTLAGEYDLTPIISYDTENYILGTVEPVKMVINKQIVPSPSDFSVEYDGKAHNPSSDDSRLSYAPLGEIREVGEYEVSVTLFDSANYELSGADSFTVTVTPRELYITVIEACMLPDGTLVDLKYDITGGSLAEGDELLLIPVLCDGAVGATSENKNYTLRVTAGELIEGSRSIGDLKVALVTVGISVFVLLIAGVVYLCRRRLFKSLIASGTAMPVNEALPAPPPLKVIEVKPETPEPEADQERNESEEVEDKSEEDPPEESGANDLMERAEKIGKVEIDMEKADTLITDALAKDLIKRADRPIRTAGSERCVINVDTLSEYFYPGERIDINVLKRRGLIPQSACFVKILARGRVDKPLSVYANEFTPAAVKMIVLSGGEAVKAQTVREKEN